MQDRYRGGGGGGGRPPGGGGSHYSGGSGGGGRRRRGRGGGNRPRDIYPDVGLQEVDEHVSWADDFEREPNPDADPLHLAYDSVYTHEGDVREELLEQWVEASNNGKRWRCWNCGRNTQRFTQLRLPTLRTVISLCDNCQTWTVWDAWRDLANPRIFNFRRTIEESEPAPTREVGPAPSTFTRESPSNGSDTATPTNPAAGAAPPVQSSADTAAPSPRPFAADYAPETPIPTPRSAPMSERGAGVPSTSEPSVPAAPPTPEPSLQPAEASTADADAAKPKRTRAPRARAEDTSPNGDSPKPRAPRARAKKAETPAE